LLIGFVARAADAVQQPFNQHGHRHHPAVDVRRRASDPDGRGLRRCWLWSFHRCRLQQRRYFVHCNCVQRHITDNCCVHVGSWHRYACAFCPIGSVRALLAGATHKFVITIEGQASATSTGSVSYIPPAISAVLFPYPPTTPGTLSVDGSETFGLTGTNFGPAGTGLQASCYLRPRLRSTNLRCAAVQRWRCSTDSPRLTSGRPQAASPPRTPLPRASRRPVAAPICLSRSQLAAS
jgi:hypothetical protein